MKRTMTALALWCLLSTTAFAGDIPSVGIASTGEIPSGGFADAAMNLIQTLLGLL
jgi:hypothetical protein